MCTIIAKSPKVCWYVTHTHTYIYIYIYTYIYIYISKFLHHKKKVQFQQAGHTWEHTYTDFLATYDSRAALHQKARYSTAANTYVYFSLSLTLSPFPSLFLFLFLSLYIYIVYMWQMLQVFFHKSAQRNDSGHLIDENVFKTTRSFCYHLFRVSTLQASATKHGKINCKPMNRS